MEVETDASTEEAPDLASESSEPSLDAAIVGLAYVPDLLARDFRFWFAPSRAEAREVYIELVGDAADTWPGYYSKKGWAFIQSGCAGAEGPFAVPEDALRFEILESGRFFVAKPTFRFRADGPALPLVGMEKRRAVNPWKPNHIKATQFIKRYEWKETVPLGVHYAVFDIEECGEIAGSTSWINAEKILRDSMSDAVRRALADIFYNRMEDYPLGSEVYLRVLGQSGDEGFDHLIELSSHPIARKRASVADALGRLEDRRGLPPLLRLLDDEDPAVRTTALRGVGRVGIDRDVDGVEKVDAYLESSEVSERVWAAQAFYRGGDDSMRKFFVNLIKEEPRLLTDMGDMGVVLRDLELFETVPYIVSRLKHSESQFREDASDALEKITGLEIGYQLDTQEERRRAIKLANSWWEERKRARGKRR